MKVQFAITVQRTSWPKLVIELESIVPGARHDFTHGNDTSVITFEHAVSCPYNVMRQIEKAFPSAVVDFKTII